MAISIDIAEGNQFTFRQLSDLQNEGYSVMRSPHFTNRGLSRANLGIAALGLEIVGYDWGWITPGGRQLARNNTLHFGTKRIAEEPLVTTIEANLYAEGALDGSTGQIQSVADYHAQKVEAGFGQGNIQTMTGLVANNRDIFHAIAQAAVTDENTRSGFADGIDQQGRKLPGYFTRNPDELKVANVYGIDNKTEVKAHVPVSVVLAALFAIQASTSEQKTVYHLAGSDMLKYIDNYRAQITLIIARLACQNLVKDDTRTVIVPSSDTLIITRNSISQDLEELFAYAQQFNGPNKRIARQTYDTYLKQFCKKLRQTTKRGLSVTIQDTEAHGGEGVSIIESALDIPIGQLQRRVRKLTR